MRFDECFKYNLILNQALDEISIENKSSYRRIYMIITKPSSTFIPTSRLLLEDTNRVKRDAYALEIGELA